MRKSIMDMYGGPARLPNINALAKDSMVYDNCIAPETWTFPSHASMFTGMYASEHGIHETKDKKVSWLIDANSKLEAERLPETMQDKGYSTLCISNNYMLTRNTGFDYGFDNFLTLETSPWSQSKLATEARNLGADPMQVLNVLVRKGRFDTIIKYAREMMRIRQIAKTANYPLSKGAELTNELLMNATLNEPLFLFVNFWEMHEPYVGFSDKELLDDLTGIKKFGDKKVEFLKRQYILEGEFLDAQVGRFIKMLKSRGLYDNSMIILTSDHGQAFDEHGYIYHGTYLYDEIVRVPLIIKYSKSKKFKKRKGYQSLVNIPRLISDIVKGKDDGSLTTRTAFAEAYGSIDFLPKSYDHLRASFEQKYEKVRKAVYMDGYKLTLNGSDGTIEEFMKDGRDIRVGSERNSRMLRLLVRKIDEFRGDEEFRLPEV